MNRRKGSKLKKLGAFIATIALSIVIIYCPLYTMTFVDYGVRQCVIPTAEFQLSWIHSVERTPWIEFYRQDSRGFKLYATEFKSFGAGTPAEGVVIPGTLGFIRYKLDLNYPKLSWIVSANAQSTLLIQDRSWAIYQGLTDYTEINIFPRGVSLGEWFNKEICYDNANKHRATI